MIGTQQLEHIGNIRRLTIPRGWLAQEQPEDLFSQAWKTEFVSESDHRVGITIYYRGKPIDLQSAQVFHLLAQSKPAFTGPEKLTPIEVISLRVLMGFETCGNNQYTNVSHPDSFEGRIFELQLAQTRRIEGHVVLFVRGIFRSGCHYAGIFYPADLAGRIIYEIGINAPSASLLSQYEQDFESLIESISWQAAP